MLGVGRLANAPAERVHEIPYSSLARKLHRARTTVGAHDDVLGLEHIDKVMNVDQDRTCWPRPRPAAAMAAGPRPDCCTPHSACAWSCG
jgi:hypothetical protein